MNEKVNQAIAAWKELLGPDGVADDQEVRLRYGKTCLPTDQVPLAVLYPQTVEEVQQICGIAQRWSVPLYPISRGRNWGYGSCAPSSPNNVVLDLARMNRIVELNQELAYAVVEPGVTQQQLYDYLKDHDIPLELDVTGAPPDASLLANIIERGYGQTPYSDHFLHSSFMEVVLADGTLLRTGFGHFQNAKTACLYKWGIGPYLDGIFTQSNFGIITKVGVWLMPKPQYFGIFFFKIKSDEQLIAIIERMRDLKLEGILRSAVHFGNDIRVLSSFQTYPWKDADGKTPLPQELAQVLLKKWGMGSWSCGGGLRGSRQEVRYRLKCIRRALKDLTRVTFLSEVTLERLKLFRGLYERITGIDLAQKLAVFGLMRGEPTERPTQALYWRKRGTIPESNFDPPADGCGIMWCSPVVPMTASDIDALVQIVRSTCEEFGFETSISLNLITARAVCAVLGIHYDRDNEEETLRASNCHAELLNRCAKSGYYPYRFGSQIGDHDRCVFNPDDPFWRLTAKLKHTLDPEGIIAPGRYSIS